MSYDTDQIKKKVIEDTARCTSLDDLEKIRVYYLGKKGIVNNLLSQIASLSPAERRTKGQKINAIKNYLESKIQLRHSQLAVKTSTDTAIDMSLPGKKPVLGHLHPTTAVIRSINSFFRYHGYSVYQGREIETDEYNFEKLNLPLDHPARDLADTLYISEPEWLLRTHTSSVETRAMTTELLPLRIVVPGKVYRNETSNVTNNSMFYHYEGLVIDRGITMANLKATLITFVKFIYGDKTKVRFRAKYYPQVEPGAGLDFGCTFCDTAGCSVCKYRGYIEVLGAGMVHPRVLSACGIDPKLWSGFAFGIGLDRLVMLKYGISDIRKLYRGELVVI